MAGDVGGGGVGWGGEGSGTGFFDNVGGAIGFFQDPPAAILEGLKDGATGLITSVLPALSGAVMPNLTLDWFVNSYAGTFAIAIFVAALLAIAQTVKTARGQLSAGELSASLFGYLPLFLIGAAFGPAIGALIVQVFNALTTTIIRWGSGGSPDSVIQQLNQVVEDTDGTTVAGGIFVAIVFVAVLLFALIGIFFVLIIQLATLYLTGMLAPLAFVFLIDPDRRQVASTFVWTWVILLSAQPVVFLLLFFVFNFIGQGVDILNGWPNLQQLVMLAVSGVLLALVSFSPMALRRFMPVIGAGSGTRSAPPSGGGRVRFGPNGTGPLTNNGAGRPQGEMRNSGAANVVPDSARTAGANMPAGTKLTPKGTGILSKAYAAQKGDSGPTIAQAQKAAKAAKGAGAASQAATGAKAASTAATGAKAAGAVGAAGTAATGVGIGVLAVGAAAKGVSTAGRRAKSVGESAVDENDANQPTIGKDSTK